MGLATDAVKLRAGGSVRSRALIPGIAVALVALYLIRRAAEERYAEGYVDGTIHRVSVA
jgi:hypothetical protein